MSEKIKIEKIPTLYIPKDKISKVYLGLNIVEVVTIKNQNNNINNYKRIGNNGCVNLLTGEFISFSDKKKSENHYSHIRKSANELRRIINLNFVGNNAEKFITLTYKEKMDNYEKVSSDFIAFWRRFKYHYPKCEYIRIIEPQNNGNWHIHVLLKNSNEKLFIERKLLCSLWSYGRVWIKNLPFTNNFGAYFSITLNINQTTSCENKASEKSKRTFYYPTKFKLYTCSKGIIKPEPIIMTHGDVQRLVDNRSPCYSYTNTITNEDGVELNTITYEQFILGEKNNERH